MYRVVQCVGQILVYLFLFGVLCLGIYAFTM
jgi:hypothetical protein